MTIERIPDDGERANSLLQNAPYVEPSCPCMSCKWAWDVGEFFQDMDEGARRMVAPVLTGCIVCVREDGDAALYAKARSYCPDGAYEPRDAV